MKKKTSNFLIFAAIASFSHLSAINYIVDIAGDSSPNTYGQNSGPTSGDLRFCINTANFNGGTNTITFDLGAGQETIPLNAMLPPLNVKKGANISIDGSNSAGSGTPITIDGNLNLITGQGYPGFVAVQGTVLLENMTIENTLARGGQGGFFPNYYDQLGGGGGGLGAGAGLFIDGAQVTISNLTFDQNIAVGGDGTFDNTNSGAGGGGMFGGDGGYPSLFSNAFGYTGGGGGGGMGGVGGNGDVTGLALQPPSGGGGGGVAPIGTGGDGLGGLNVNGEQGGIAAFGIKAGNGAGLYAGKGGETGGGGGGGGLISPSEGGAGGGGGILGDDAINSNGADGGYGGGGGGGGFTALKAINPTENDKVASTAQIGSSPNSFGGNGGFGGGGGGGCNNQEAVGGAGGFGGGGGGGSNYGGNGGFGGGGGYGANGTHLALGAGGLGGIGAGDGDGNDALYGFGTGGGGAGLGGAIFVNGSQEYSSGGGTLTIAGPLTLVNQSVNFGTGANNGAAAADKIFFTSTNAAGIPLTFDLPTGVVVTIDGVIGDESLATLPSGQSYTQGTSSKWTGIEKRGLGKLTLTAQNSYAGKTTVYSGELNLNGAIASDCYVESGATITGVGYVGRYIQQEKSTQLFGGNLTIFSGGTIRPGNSIGTLHVLGNFNIETGATYIVQFNGLGQSNLIDIDGSATLKGGLVIADPLDLPPSTTPYLILHADGGRGGTFDGVVTSVPISGFVPELVYDANNVYLVFVRGNTNNFFASTCNQKAVANILTTLTDVPDDLSTILSALVTLPQSQAQLALDQISGEQYTTLLTTAELTGQQFIRRLYDPLRTIVTTYPCYNCCCCNPTFDAWFEGGGGRTNIDGNVNVHNVKVDSYEFTGGVQSTFSRDWTLGASVSYAHDKVDYKVGGSGTNKTVIGGFYGLYRPQDFYILGDIAFGYSKDTVRRNIVIGDLAYKASSSPKVYQGIAYAEIGLDLCFPCAPCILLQPFGGIEVSVLRRSQFSEHGADILNLSVAERTHTNAFTRLGFHMTTRNINCFAVSLDLAWQHRLTTTSTRLREHFVDFGDDFFIYGNAIGRDSLDGALTVTADVYNNWQLYAEAAGQVWSHASSYSVLGGIQFSW